MSIEIFGFGFLVDLIAVSYVHFDKSYGANIEDQVKLIRRKIFSTMVKLFDVFLFESAGKMTVVFCKPI